MRSSWVLVVGILSGIAAAESNISCVHCVGENVKTCQGIPKKCPSDSNECVSVLELTRIGVREISLFMRLCGNCSQQKTGTVRFDKGILNINATCCSGDRCTPPVPTIPPTKPAAKDEKVKASGLRCKSCYASNSKGCDCTVLVNCTIGETKCILRHISATKGHNHMAAIRGCTTEDMCYAKDLELNTTKVKYTISCSDDGDRVHDSPLLLVLTTALFSKITTT